MIEFEENLIYLADPAYVSKNNFQTGNEISLSDFIKDNELYLYQTALDAAFNYLSYAPRTEKQIINYLSKKHIYPDIITKVLKKLKEYKFADDELFAKNYVSYGLDAKKGRQYLKQKLNQKGVSEKHIADSLKLYSEETETENARNFIKKQNELLKKYPPVIRKEKIFRKAVSQGFSLNIMRELLRELVSEEDDGGYEEYFIGKIDKKCAAYIKKGLGEKEIRTKLYAVFLVQGAKKAVIDERIHSMLNNS